MCVCFFLWVRKLFDYSYCFILCATHTYPERESFDSGVRLSCWFSWHNARIFLLKRIYVYTLYVYIIEAKKSETLNRCIYAVTDMRKRERQMELLNVMAFLSITTMLASYCVLSAFISQHKIMHERFTVFSLPLFPSTTFEKAFSAVAFSLPTLLMSTRISLLYSCYAWFFLTMSSPSSSTSYIA